MYENCPIMNGISKDMLYPHNLLLDMMEITTRINVSDVPSIPDPMHVTQDQIDGLEFAIETLLPSAKKAVDLIYRKGMTITQAAKELQMSQSAVNQSRRHGLIELRKASRFLYSLRETSMGRKARSG